MTQSSWLVNTVWQLPGKAREKKKKKRISTLALTILGFKAANILGSKASIFT